MLSLSVAIQYLTVPDIAQLVVLKSLVVTTPVLA